MARIKDSVAEGGHNVLVEDVRRRFLRGVKMAIERFLTKNYSKWFREARGKPPHPVL
jgi:predicted ABC-type ATPase